MDIAEEPTEKKKRIGVRTLSSPADVSRLLGKLIRLRLQNDGEIDDACLRAITSACAVLLKSIEQSDMDKRLSEIESQLQQYELEHV